VIIGQRYRTELSQKQYDVVVIGSGMGGLSTAGLLARLGRSVLVLEQHYTAGGATHTFSRKGFEWNTGLHYVGAVHHAQHPFRRMFDLLSDKKLNWHWEDKVYDRFIFPDRTYNLRPGEEAFLAELLSAFPTERDALTKYLRLIQEAQRSATAYSFSRVFPKLTKALPFTPFPDYFYRTTYEVLRSLTTNEKLIAVLCGQFGNYGLTPKQSSFGIHAIIAYHYLHGSSFPVGGANEVARTMVASLNRLGVTVAVNADVEKILVKDNVTYGVRLKNGDEIKAKVVVSSAGLAKTYTKFLNVPNKQLPALTLGYISLAVGIDAAPEVLQYDGANIWHYSSYDHDNALASYLQRSNSAPPMSYLSFACLKDPSWKERIGNKTAIDILGVLPTEWFAQWQDLKRNQRGQEYEALKQQLASPYMDTLFKLFPQLKNHVSHLEISSTLTVKHYYGNAQGEIYGAAATPARYQNQLASPHTGIKGLYLTGQDTLFHGICGAMMSGVTTTMAIAPFETGAMLLPHGVFDRY
jgi:all-trans-retinol 13,14-reductase